jgi:iron complex outermembrane recepter protein
VRFLAVSPYLHGEYTPTDRVHLSAGVRLDRMGYRYESHLPVSREGSHRRPADASPTFDALSPKLGVTVQAAPGLNVFAAYRRGFRAPSEGQLFRQGSAESTVDLEPVKADSWEGGVRGALGRRVRFEASAYRMTKTDDILAFRHPDGSTETVNAGETLHRGIELGVGVQVAPGVSLEGSYTIARHTYESWTPRDDLDLSGNEMEAAPRQVGSARVTWAPSLVPGARAGVEWTRVGPYWMDASNENAYEGHDVVSLRMSYDLGDRVELFGRVTNLTDARYAETASFNEFRGEELAPGLPRTLYLGARIR